MLACCCVLALSFIVRGLTAQFIRAHLNDPGWFQTGTYSIFDTQARAILDGTASAFLITDPTHTQAAIYPPGYALWLSLIYKLSGTSSVKVVQNVQWVLDALAVLLLVGIGATAFCWRVGLIAGALAALSPLLALYGSIPLADAPTSWTVLGGVWMFLLALKRHSWRWALGAGSLIGASCWLRANGLLLAMVWAVSLLFFMRVTWREKLSLSGAILSSMLLLVTPILIRNAVAFHAFLPTGLGVGTNLWEGIGETERATEFGAVYGDVNLIEQERATLHLATDAPLGLYQPDGVQRDRERARRALSVIKSHPVWYTGVMLRRMWGVLNYTGKASSFYGYAGVNITSRKILSPDGEVGIIARLIDLLGMVQSVWQHLALPLIGAGILFALNRDQRMTGLLLATVFYYLVIGSFVHMEIRYGLPMQAALLVFAAFAVVRVGEIWREIRQGRRGLRARRDQGRGAGEAAA